MDRHWVETRGEGGLCLLTWGSSAGAVFEAARRLHAQGTAVRVIAVRLLAPLQRQALRELLDGAERILVVEQNHQAQFFRYLHAQQVLPDSRRNPLPDPVPSRCAPARSWRGNG